jgi:hypothetical protein
MKRGEGYATLEGFSGVRHESYTVVHYRLTLQRGCRVVDRCWLTLGGSADAISEASTSVGILNVHPRF